MNFNRQKNTVQYSPSDILVCAAHGIVYAVDKSKGTVLWECQPLTPTFGGAASLFVTDSNKVIVGLEGKVICLNLLNGDILWKNDMNLRSSRRYEVHPVVPASALLNESVSSAEVSIVVEPSKVLSLRYSSTLSNDMDVPPGYDDTVGSISGSNIVSSSNGKVVARDAKTGKKVWTYDCTGGTRTFTSVLICEPSCDDSGKLRDTVFVGVGRSIHCLDAKTGELIWYSRVANGTLGYNFMTIATMWSSRLSGETNTAFSQQPVIFAKRSDERGTMKLGARVHGTDVSISG
ncbi:unnamed protein product [Mucor hiemalis]